MVVGRTDHGRLGGEWTVVSIVAAVVVGVVLTAGAALVLAAVTSSLPAGALGSPLLGGASAGYRSRGRPAVGAATGFVVGALLGIVVVGNFLAWAAADAPVAGGAGLAAGPTGLALVGACVLAAALASVGGVLGAFARYGADGRSPT